ncbi:MAG: 4'-phosphopantetheinyl transferase superfamily protein [Paludibacteraceae bacterium]|nr:4'-phosphopantetheinyl transferase superfamily protein [Paludibacteraceae bacterium]
MLLIHDDMSQCTEQEVTRLLQIVPAPRCDEALRYKHTFGRYCCLRSWEMLSELLRREGITSMPRWRYNEYGKPYLEQGPYFSISHCKQAILVAVSDREIGVDVETIRRADDSLVRRTMNEAEQAQIAAAPDPQRAFIALWTRKEAVVKMRGTGILDDLHRVLDQQDYQLQTIDHSKMSYIYSVAERCL